MGLFKRIIKFILYQLPKKWLIMIIFALAMTFGLTQVKGASYIEDTDIVDSRVTFYEWLDIGARSFDTGIVLTGGNSSSFNHYGFYLDFAQSSKMYAKTFSFNDDNFNTNDSNQGAFTMEAQYNGQNRWCRFNRSWNYRCTDEIVWNNLDRRNVFLDYNTKVVSYNGNTWFNFSSVPMKYSNYSVILNANSGYYSTNFRVYNMKVYDNNNILMTDYLPCKYTYIRNQSTTDIIYGFYDLMNDRILVYATNPSSISLGNEVGSPLFTTPFIENSSSSIINWSFNSLNIDGGSVRRSQTWGDSVFWLYVDYNGQRNYIDLANYMQTVQPNNVRFSIPKNVLVDSSAIASGRDIEFTFYWTYPNGNESVASNWEHRWYEIGTYTLSLTQTEQDNINNDQVIGAISGLNGSIDNLNTSVNTLNNTQQETNDFLKDTNVNSSGFNVNAPSVEGQAVVSQVDNSFTSFFNDYMGILQGTSVYSIVLPIPDMRNGNVLTSINISSDYISSKLSSVPLFIPNTSLLELIHITWYLLFGFWFLFLATKLVTIIYSGDIIKNQGLLDLTRTYIGVSKNML